MPRPSFIDRVNAYLDGLGTNREYNETEIAGFALLRSQAPTSLKAVVYNPLLCLILQGEKETHLGEQQVKFAAGESLIVSHHLPVVSRITKASTDKPYIAIVLSLDLSIVRSLYDEVGEGEMQAEQARALDVGETEAALIDALRRLFDLIDRPLEAKVMAPLVLREIHFRLLMAQHGGMLRQLLQRGSHASRLTKVLERIKNDYTAPLAVTELASIAGMSPSSFHEHFKALTATTPLQYQKNLRLIEARRLLLDCGHNVSSAAFEVGYESPTQFTREYTRKFGASPSSHKAGVVAV